MDELTENQKIITDFLYNTDIPVNKFYVSDPSCIFGENNFGAIYFIFSNKMLYKSLIRRNFPKDYLYYEDVYNLFDYTTYNFDLLTLDKIAIAIKNPQLLDLNFFKDFFVEDAFKQIIKKEYDISQIRLEQQSLLTNIDIKNNATPNINKI